MGKGCSWGTGATRFRRERCMSHFATKFEPLLRIKGDRLKFRTGVCGEQNGTNAVKINRRWVLVSPVLIDGIFNTAWQGQAMAEDDMTGDSVIVDSSSVTTSSSSSNDSDQRRKSNKSSSRKGEEDVDSQVTQKPPLPNSGDEAERNRRLGSSTEAPSEGIVNRQAQDEERPKARRQGKGRIRELEELKAELAEKEVELLEKERELLQQEQTLIVLQEELEIERKIRALVTKEKEEAEEEAALAMGLCVGGSMLP